MVHKHYYTIIALLLITLCFTASTPLYAQTYIEDALHRTITIEKTPSRVISLAPSITEILFALGLEDKVIGVDSISYNDTYLGIHKYVIENNVTSVGGYWWSTISVETILSLEPDLILADAGAHVKLLDTFEEYNLTTVYLYGGSAKSLQDIYYDIDVISKIFGVNNTITSQLINDIEENISKAKTIIDNIGFNRTVRVLVVVGFYNGIWVAGKATFIDDIVSRIGLVNVANNVGWYTVNIETISALNPDVIVVTNMGGFVTNSTLEEYGLTSIGTKILLLSPKETDLLTRPGPLIGYGAILLAKRIAELFPAPTTTTSVIKEYTTSTTTTTETTTTTTATTTSIQEQESQNYIPYIAMAVIAIVALGIGYFLGKKIR
ncbi:ABC transporter substrate-binding protein [Desulfurococcaceae archaeon MEX13E-LK6-19]|nr:ABC transporter substrate-binding protein [Desulfurococcaceae archaeon MEX13E-LK6-19]